MTSKGLVYKKERNSQSPTILAFIQTSFCIDSFRGLYLILVKTCTSESCLLTVKCSFSVPVDASDLSFYIVQLLYCFSVWVWGSY